MPPNGVASLSEYSIGRLAIRVFLPCPLILCHNKQITYLLPF